jgi:hypothetical protein
MRVISCVDGSTIKVGLGPELDRDRERQVKIEIWDCGGARLSPSDARRVAAALLNAAAAIDKQEPDGKAVPGA